MTNELLTKILHINVKLNYLFKDTTGFNFKINFKISKGFPNRGDMILNVPIGLI